MNSYSEEFFDHITPASEASAEILVPAFMELFAPKVVVDIGCGQGAWAGVFEGAGAEVLGVDGDYVRRDELTIPSDQFQSHDLTQPLVLDRRFDLAVSLEVGEHLPASSAATFVESIVNAAPIVVFSAAVPCQGGTSHLNEQWPKYWADLFAAHDYDCYDILRWRFWNDERIAWYYRQNMLVFAHREMNLQVPALRDSETTETPNAVVHPIRWLQRVGHPKRKPTVTQAARALAGAIRRFILPR